MVKVTMLLFATLFLLEQCWFCTGLVINPASSGGAASGDPAPGRSPGPPHLEATVVPVPETVDKVDKVEECELDGEVNAPPENLLNVTLLHRLFNTDKLVPGIEYQGRSEAIQFFHSQIILCCTTDKYCLRDLKFIIVICKFKTTLPHRSG
jgi:hypothetical protein